MPQQPQPLQQPRRGRSAEQQGTRLLTFTVDTDVSFATPNDLERFTTALADFVARQAAQYQTPGGGRRYRAVLSGHPVPKRAISPKPCHDHDLRVG